MHYIEKKFFEKNFVLEERVHEHLMQSDSSYPIYENVFLESIFSFVVKKKTIINLKFEL